MEHLKNITDILKLSSRYLFPLAFVTGMLLFSGPVAQFFNLTNLISQYHPYFSLVFLLSSGLVITDWLIRIGDWLLRKNLERKNRISQKKQLLNLTWEEKGILSRYIEEKVKTREMAETGVVKGLENSGIIYHIPHIGGFESNTYMIQSWVWNYLNEHPELLELSTDEKNKLNTKEMEIARERISKYSSNRN